MLFLKNRHQLIKIIKEKDQQIFKLNDELLIEKFKATKGIILGNYCEGKHITEDFMIIEHLFIVSDNPLKFRSFFDFLTSYFKPKKRIVQLKFKCKDLRTEENLIFTEEEILKINNIAIAQ